MINSYERTISQYKKDELPKEKYKSFDLVKEELSDLLDFVQDIPEETGTNAVVVITKLSKRVAELEESCQCMCDIEKNLHKLLENSSLNFKNLEKKNEALRLDNISWQKKCIESKYKNKVTTDLETFIKTLKRGANI